MCYSIPKHLPSCVNLPYAFLPVDGSSGDWTVSRTAPQLLSQKFPSWVSKAAFPLPLDRSTRVPSLLFVLLLLGLLEDSIQ